MAIVKKFDVGPELLGNWVAESSAGKQTRQNLEESRKYGLDVAELNQRGAIAAAQLTQNAIDRDTNVAMRMNELGMRAAENRFDAQNRLELEKLQGQQQDARIDKAQQNQFAEIEMRANAEQAARDRAMITVPDFNEGPIQNHEIAIANQRLAGQMGQSFQRELLAKIAVGDPDAIRQGLSEGLMRFTPAQKQEAAELQSALAKLNSPEMHPTDRVRGQAILMAKLRAIQPQLVPEDEREPDLNTIVNKSIAVWTNPIDKKMYPITLDRNGEPRVLDTNQQKMEVPKPTTIRERIATDPAFHSAQLSAAYKRVEQRKKDDYEVAKESALLHGTAVPAYSPPDPVEVHAELNEFVETADYQNAQFGGAMPPAGMPAAPQQSMPPAAQPPAGPQAAPTPPPAVDEAVKQFAAASGIPIAPPAGAQLPPSRFGQKAAPTAQPQPNPGLTDDLAKSLVARVQKYRDQAAKQGGKLDANDYSHYVALCNDLGIAP